MIRPDYANPESETMNNEKMNCETCQHWKRLELNELYRNDSIDKDDISEGHCRRYPPVIISDELGASRRFSLCTKHGMISHATMYPITWSDNTCGEWKP